MGSTEPAGPVFAAIDHVGIAVPDYEAALALYRDVYGMRVVHEEVNTEQGVREAMLEVGPGGGPLIQLLAPLGPDSPVARFLDRHGPGLQQLAFRVDDVSSAAERVRRHGLRTVGDEPVRGTAGSSIMFLHPKDAGGVLVELVQPAGEREGDAPRRTPDG